MEPVVYTPRLKLVLLTDVQPGSAEFEWLHELHTDQQTTWWSISGQSKSHEDTARFASKYLSPLTGESDNIEKTYNVAYAVHTISKPTSQAPTATDTNGELTMKTNTGSDVPLQTQAQAETETTAQGSTFIGLVTVLSVRGSNLPLPEHLTISAEENKTTLATEIGYMFLPRGWGAGHATEAVAAVFEACKRAASPSLTPTSTVQANTDAKTVSEAKSFWAPFEKVHVRAIVNAQNPASMRVMQKTGMVKRGVYEWKGEAIFLAGEWRDRDDLHIYGKYLVD